MIIAAVSAGAVVVASRWSTPRRRTNHLGVFVVGQRVRKRGDVDARRQRGVARSIDRLRRRHRHRQVRPPVERPGEDDDVRPAGHLLGQLDRRLGDLGAGVGEEERVDGAGYQFGQPGGQWLEQIVGEHVGLEVDTAGRLPRDRLDDLGVAVAGRVHRDAGCEVEVLDTVDGRHPASLSTGDLQVRDLEPHVGQVRHVPRLGLLVSSSVARLHHVVNLDWASLRGALRRDAAIGSPATPHPATSRDRSPRPGTVRVRRDRASRSHGQ